MSFRITSRALLRPAPLANRVLPFHLGLRASTTSSVPKPGFPANTTPAEAHSILVAQRRNRPIAPHLSIYKPQLTWYGSAANRITSVALSGLIYAYFSAYAVAPFVGWQLDIHHIAEVFGTFPAAAKIAVKTALAAPFMYHNWNSLRHLAWDWGKLLDIQDVYRTGYAMLVATAISTIWLVMI